MICSCWRWHKSRWFPCHIDPCQITLSKIPNKIRLVSTLDLARAEGANKQHQNDACTREKRSKLESWCTVIKKRKSSCPCLKITHRSKSRYATETMHAQVRKPQSREVEHSGARKLRPEGQWYSSQFICPDNIRRFCVVTTSFSTCWMNPEKCTHVC